MKTQSLELWKWMYKLIPVGAQYFKMILRDEWIHCSVDLGHMLLC